jgi:aspartyl-tRNA(Asn)/glutamyl-tRNA(Gln) amidotransferase subunit C
MKIGPNEVDYVAKLAHLAISEKEKITFIGQLNSILEYVEQLNTLDTSQVKPTAQVVYTKTSTESMRDDSPQVTFSQADSLQNAPSKSAGHFKVPKVIADR